MVVLGSRDERSAPTGPSSRLRMAAEWLCAQIPIYHATGGPRARVALASRRPADRATVDANEDEIGSSPWAAASKEDASLRRWTRGGRRTQEPALGSDPLRDAN